MPKILIVIAILILGTGCSNKLITVHKLDIQQGNALKQSDAQKIKAGMTQDQVIKLLGNPVLKSTLNANRWDYIYHRQKPYENPEKLRLFVYFQNKVVTRVESQGM